MTWISLQCWKRKVVFNWPAEAADANVSVSGSRVSSIGRCAEFELSWVTQFDASSDSEKSSRCVRFARSRELICESRNSEATTGCENNFGSHVLSGSETRRDIWSRGSLRCAVDVDGRRHWQAIAGRVLTSTPPCLLGRPTSFWERFSSRCRKLLPPRRAVSLVRQLLRRHVAWLRSVLAPI